MGGGCRCFFLLNGQNPLSMAKVICRQSLNRYQHFRSWKLLTSNFYLTDFVHLVKLLHLCVLNGQYQSGWNAIQD